MEAVAATARREVSQLDAEIVRAKKPCEGALGFRTPERGWWIANVVLSILTATYLGAPTLPSALWTVGRVLAARMAG